MDDEKFMAMALEAAQKASMEGEVPVGAVLVFDNKPIVIAHNKRETLKQPGAHAEVLAIQEGARLLQRWRLIGCSLYVTLEPCVMCAGAIVLARLDRVVFALRDPKAGAVVSLYQVLNDPRLNHRPSLSEGIGSDQSKELLKSFFRERRTKRRH